MLCVLLRSKVMPPQINATPKQTFKKIVATVSVQRNTVILVLLSGFSGQPILLNPLF